MSYYVQDKKGAGMLRWLEGKDRGVVHIDRTKALDFMVTELIADRFKYYMAANRLTEYFKLPCAAVLPWHLEKVFSGAGCGVVETEPLPGQGSKQPDRLDNTPRSGTYGND